ncbi:MAG: polysaccharide biosynthesis C-terminal domain-containing protein, partial [Lentisphaeria bacterium]|nr:polysaccharide biosynthesis C-terminal domain-containing protein [Lentisphaeria bacterium]
AIVYMRILFLGMPFLQIFNIGSAVLRAVGDTKRPMYILLIAGLFNLLMNMFFVIRCNMDVDGVAYATVLSRILSAIMVCVVLSRTGEGVTLSFRELCMDFRILGRILYIGVPAGIRGSCFSFSNVIIMTSINSFGSYCVAGCAADIALEGMVCTWSGSVSTATISFVGQNYGAKKYDRIRKCIAGALTMGILGMMILGFGGYAFGESLIGLFNNDQTVIDWGMQRMRIVFLTYFIFNIQDVFGGVLSGMGRSVLNTIIRSMGSCGFRSLWVFDALPHDNTLQFLMLSYPLSWVVTNIMLGVYLFCVLKKYKKGI